MDRIEEIRARLAKITPGPWHWDGYEDLRSFNDMAIVEGGCYFGDDGKFEDNKAFIAAAPEDVASLLSQLEQAKGLLTRVSGLSIILEGEHTADGNDEDCDMCNWMFDVAAFLNPE